MSCLTENTDAAHYNLCCNYGKNGEFIYSKISLEDKDYVLSLKCSWYFWKGGNSVKNSGGYIRAHLNEKSVYLHHIIMEHTGFSKPSENHSIDHINRDKLDNRRENLRWATQSEQNANTDKRNRKYNARSLPEGVTQDMLPKYVVYYKECYNKEKNSFREFFKIEKHPENPKIIIGSKSNKVSIQDKLKEIKEKLDAIGKPILENPNEDETDKLMKSLPTGIQYIKETDKRGSKYVLSRRITPDGKDKSSSSSKSISDKEKFLKIYSLYLEIKNVK